MTNRFALRLTILATLGLLGAGCSTSTTCDDTKCLPGNQCVAGKCMLTCKRHFECPGGYDCKPIAGETLMFCQENGKPSAKGQYGTSCAGEGKGDAACDATNNFRCSTAASDPDAYCTATCTKDDNCPGGYWCVGQDKADGTLEKTCQKRGFCAPAPTGVVDCADPAATILTEGADKYCSRDCASESGSGCGAISNFCNANLKCAPRAGTCAPTHDFCGRCNSSEDCPSGSFCWKVAWGAEAWCTAPCASGSCPTNPLGDLGRASACMQIGACTGAATDDENCVPAGKTDKQCLPYDSASQELGCWLATCDDPATCYIKR